eukprot:179907_1
MGSCCTSSKNQNKGKARLALQQIGKLFTHKSLPKIPKSMQNRIDKNMWKEFQNLCYTATVEQPPQSKCFRWFSFYLTISGIVLCFLTVILIGLYGDPADCEMGRKRCDISGMMLIFGFIAFVTGFICILINDTRSKYDEEVRNNLNKSLPKFNHKYRTKIHFKLKPKSTIFIIDFEFEIKQNISNNKQNDMNNTEKTLNVNKVMISKSCKSGERRNKLKHQQNNQRLYNNTWYQNDVADTKVSITEHDVKKCTQVTYDEKWDYQKMAIQYTKFTNGCLILKCIESELGLLNVPQLLSLHGLYKQIMRGDNNEQQPSYLYSEKTLKWKAWNKYKGLSKQQAMIEWFKIYNKIYKIYPKIFKKYEPNCNLNIYDPFKFVNKHKNKSQTQQRIKTAMEKIQKVVCTRLKLS